MRGGSPGAYRLLTMQQPLRGPFKLFKEKS